VSVSEKGERQTCPRRESELERAREGGVSVPEKGERHGCFGGRVCEVLRARVGTRGASTDRRRRNRIHTGKEVTRQCKTNSRHKIIQTLSEVAHKNRENHFARRTQGSEARIQHTLTWKVIQDTHNTEDKTRHIQEAGNTQAR
jgi:hypothetical protein